MVLKSQQRSLLVISVLVTLCLIVCVATFMRFLGQVKTEVENTFHSRHELVTQFVALQRDRVMVMRNLFMQQYQQGIQPGSPPLRLVQYADLGFWALDAKPSVAGSVTGIGELPLTAQIEREIVAALAMDAQILPALALDQEVVWLYFQSRNRFIYIAPKTPSRIFHATPELYKKDYWLDSIPENNPAHRLILKGPYEDMGGKGWVITFAQSVYHEDQFLGVVALDLSVHTLENLTNVGAAAGETLLIGDGYQLIARQSGFEPGVLLHLPLSNSLTQWDKGAAGDLWLRSNIVEHELWLVHRLTRSELWLAAARNSTGVWFVAVLIAILAGMSLRLQHSLADVTRLMRVDPLTQAFNRRGFFELADIAIAVATRKHLNLAVLMMDIDFFKKINDTYGHAEGDAVLKQLGTYVLNARRPSDVFCRWGGEEFVILMTLDQADDAFTVAERIRAEAQRTRISQDNSPVTLSGGLVILGANETLEAAINRADELLYQSKQNGRNRITCGK